MIRRSYVKNRLPFVKKAGIYLEEPLDKFAAGAHVALGLAHGRVPLVEPELGVVAESPL